jgi:hypothetical protein
VRAVAWLSVVHPLRTRGNCRLYCAPSYWALRASSRQREHLAVVQQAPLSQLLGVEVSSGHPIWVVRPSLCAFGQFHSPSARPAFYALTLIAVPRPRSSTFCLVHCFVRSSPTRRSPRASLRAAESRRANRLDSTAGVSGSTKKSLPLTTIHSHACLHSVLRQTPHTFARDSA